MNIYELKRKLKAPFTKRNSYTIKIKNSSIRIDPTSSHVPKFTSQYQMMSYSQSWLESLTQRKNHQSQMN